MPTRLQNMIGRGIDMLAKGNNYNAQTGTYSNVGRGLLARAGQVGATVIGGPLAGAAVGQAGNNWVNNGNPLDFSGNDSRLGQLVQAFMGNNDIGAITRTQFRPDTSLSVGGSRMPVSMPPVNVPAPEAPWAGLGTRTGDVFGGGSLGSWANSNSGPSVAQQATGGASQGGGNGQGWTGISGDAARGMFGGMRDGSNDAIKMAEMLAMSRQKQ